MATKNGHEAVIRYLVDHGSNVHYKKMVGQLRHRKIAYLMYCHVQDGVTALHIASYQGHKEIVRYLYLERKVDINSQDKVIEGGGWGDNW